jgi:hypothetical protein
MTKPEYFAKSIAIKYGKNTDERDDINIICLEYAIGKDYPDSLLFVAMKRIALNFIRQEKRRSRKFGNDKIINEDHIIEYLDTSIKLDNIKTLLNKEENNILDLIIIGHTSLEVSNILGIPLSSSILKVKKLKNKIKKLW